MEIAERAAGGKGGQRSDPAHHASQSVRRIAGQQGHPACAFQPGLAFGQFGADGEIVRCGVVEDAHARALQPHGGVGQPLVEVQIDIHRHHPLACALVIGPLRVGRRSPVRALGLPVALQMLPELQAHRLLGCGGRFGHAGLRNGCGRRQG